MFEQHNTNLQAELQPGDRIKLPRAAYSHWAVYIGGNRVVHVTVSKKDSGKVSVNSGILGSCCGIGVDKAVIMVDDFWEVVKDCKAEKNNSLDDQIKPLSQTEIVEKALSKIGKHEYHVLFDNCEHFATWCRYGISKSEQADKILKDKEVTCWE